MHIETLKVIEEPVTYAEAKIQCRLLDDSKATEIKSLITSARSAGERISNQVLAQKEMLGVLDAFPISDDFIKIPAYPVTAVTELKYIDSEGTEKTFTDFELDKYTSKIVLNDGAEWPTDELKKVNPIQIKFNAGYNDTTLIKSELKQAVLIAVRHWEENKEEVIIGAEVSQLPLNATSIFFAHRKHGLDIE